MHRRTALLSVALAGCLVSQGAALAYGQPASRTATEAHKYGRSLFATDGIAPRNVWAVGLTQQLGAAIWHWDGTGWASSPHPGTANPASFNGISARTATDAWAVGNRDADSGLRVAYTQHWDGAHWRKIGADPGMFVSEAHAVDARTANDAWLVGEAQRSAAGSLIGLIEHWDGTRWRRVPSAPGSAGCDVTLSDVAAISAADVWAVGSRACNGKLLAFAEHWDGESWTRVSPPKIWRKTMSALNGVVAFASNDVWAVGYASHLGSPGQTMAVHWDGVRWSVGPTPNPGDATCDHVLNGVSGIGTEDLWAAGSRSCTDGVTPEMLHWNGEAWDVSPVPPSGFDDPPGDGLYDVVGTGPGSAFTVGIGKTRGGSVEAGFIERWNGRRWALQ